MLGLKSLIRRQSGLSAAEQNQLAAELKAVELPQTRESVEAKAGSIRSIAGRVDASARDVLSGDSDQDTVFLGRLSAIEQAVSGVTASVAQDTDGVSDPVTFTQQLQFLARELGVLEEHITRIGGAIGGFRGRISRLLQQVETAETSLASKEDNRHSLQNGRAASNAVLREREKKIAALDGQIQNSASKLSRKKRALRDMQTGSLEAISVEQQNGNAEATVGSLLSEIESIVARLDVSHAPIEDPETHFPDAVARVRSRQKKPERMKVDSPKGTAETLKANTGKTNAALSDSIAPKVAIFNQALDETVLSVIAELEGGVLTSSGFLRALNAKYNALLKENGLGSLSAQVRGSSAFIESLPQGFNEAMDCLEALQDEWQQKQKAAEGEIGKIERRYREECKRSAGGQVRAMPQIHSGKGRGGMQNMQPPQSPLFNSKYKGQQSRREEARLKLEFIQGALKGQKLSSPIRAVLRWMKRKSN
ncbi:hypothetical protein CO157_04595 [Candidatus Peregrinibacteria bacterium CG_4_9_14_3_um_filter_49_12]|nr:MAG: hypothetical protein CO157_04595 [Candidatus Peregrinibacteria bacterium CG_4_9_14_3_um_filter_49_12]